MDIFERRQLIATIDNPNKALDFIVSLKHSHPSQELSLEIRYIPDKLIIKNDSFSLYVEKLFSQNLHSLEEMAAILLDDLNNELVCRWVQVKAHQTKTDCTQHSVLLEDRQPQWENPALLARMAKI